MSKHTVELTDQQVRALNLLTALLPPEVAAKPIETIETIEAVEAVECSATRKDGKACQGTPLAGRDVCVAHTKAKQPKQAKPKQAKAKQAKAKQAPTVVRSLRQGTRKDFIAALKEEQGVDLTGKSTREIAQLLVAKGSTLTAPKGWKLGEGYYELVKEELGKGRELSDINIHA